MLPDSDFPEPGLPEPGLPEPASQVRGFWPATTASALLHLALGFALIRLVPAPSPPVAELSDSAVVVRIATPAPQNRASAPDPAAMAGRESGTEHVPAAEPPADLAPAESTPSDLAPTEAPAPPATDEAPTQQPGVALDIATLQNSISGQMQVYRRDVLNQEMQECRQYRERYDRWDCPQQGEVKSATQELLEESFDATFRAYSYGHEANARISKELLADMDAMRPLMDDPGVLGTLARERYYFKAEQYKYLNPGGGRADMITLASITPGGISILNGLLTLSFKDGKVDVMNRGPAKPFDEEE